MLTRLAKWWLRRKGFDAIPSTGNVVYVRGPVTVTPKGGATIAVVYLGEGASLDWQGGEPVTVSTFRVEGTGTVKGPTPLSQRHPPA